MTVSLVATVFNEARSLERWLASIDAQTRSPEEIVIVDAGSRDGTWERLSAWAGDRPGVRLLEVSGCNVPEGRNAAIAAAGGPLICVCDAGTVLEPDWLEQIVAPLERDQGVGVSGGFFRPAGDTRFERVLAAVVTPRLPEIDPERYLPSSRSLAFRKQWWERAGGYPEWLRAGEDLVFDFALLRAGARLHFAPDAVVWWSPQSSLRGFFWQYWHYARGDGHGHLWPWRHAARYGSYALGGALLALSCRRGAIRPLLRRGNRDSLASLCLEGAGRAAPVRPRRHRRGGWARTPNRRDRRRRKDARLPLGSVGAREGRLPGAPADRVDPLAPNTWPARLLVPGLWGRFEPRGRCTRYQRYTARVTDPTRSAMSPLLSPARGLEGRSPPGRMLAVADCLACVVGALTAGLSGRGGLGRMGQALALLPLWVLLAKGRGSTRGITCASGTPRWTSCRHCSSG